MIGETRSIKVTADTTVSEVLEAADEAPIWIERDGVVYVI
jgi:hypothetical protein